MHEGGGHLAALLVLVAVSVVGPLLAARVKLPAAVVLILAGVLVGPGVTGIVHDGVIVSFVSELGFLILMFIAGMELDFDALRAAPRHELLMPLLAMFVVFGLALGGGGLLGLSGVEKLVVSATSVGMPLAVLQETGNLRTPLGRHVMLAASLGEFLAILVIVGFEVLVGEGGLRFSLVLHLAKLALALGGAATLIRFARALVWWYPDALRRMTLNYDVSELGVRSGLLLMLVFVLGMALLGVEPILGAFIAGALVAFVLREKHALEAKIAALGNGLFVPVFFVVVGVRFDPTLLDLPAVGHALSLVAIAAAVKIVPTAIFAPRGFGLRRRFASGLLLAAPLTLVVAIAEIGRKLELIDGREHAALVLVALVLSVAFPALFRVVLGKRAQDQGDRRGEPEAAPA